MIIDTTRGPHPTLLMLEVRKAMLPHSESHEPTGELITSPWDLFSVEMLRDKHVLRKGASVPTDVFTFGFGEPSDLSATKVGGKATFPRSMKWPNSKSGQPLRFLGQLNFSQSKDLFDIALPGDLLILATEDDEDWIWEDDGLYCIWVKDVSDLHHIDVPTVENVGGPFFGVIHRTNDYPDSIDAAYELDVSQSYQLPIVNGTKIGGLPAYIQDGGEPNGIFLGQLGSIQAAPYAPYPWVNQPEPMGLDFNDSGIYGDSNCAVFGDMGNIYLHLLPDGSVTRSFECY